MGEHLGLEMPQLQQAQAIHDLQSALSSKCVESLAEALTAAAATEAPEELVAQAQQLLAEERRTRFLTDLPTVVDCHETLAIRAAIAEGEALGFSEEELGPLRTALEEELSQMIARAMEFRKEQEKLAAEFRTAKEAQDLGGAILVAQWRAAVAEVAKPFVFSEEDERERQNK